MSQTVVYCEVCGSLENVVCSLQTAKEILQKWADILCTPSLLQSPRQKKICLVHFNTKYHGILKNPVCRRGPYIFFLNLGIKIVKYQPLLNHRSRQTVQQQATTQIFFFLTQHIQNDHFHPIQHFIISQKSPLIQISSYLRKTMKSQTCPTKLRR